MSTNREERKRDYAYYNNNERHLDRRAIEKEREGEKERKFKRARGKSAN